MILLYRNGFLMEKINISIKIDENLLNQLQDLMENLGLDVREFFIMIAKQAIREWCLPYIGFEERTINMFILKGRKKFRSFLLFKTENIYLKGEILWH